MTVTVTDWISGERLWYAHLLDRKPKKDEGDIPSGPHTDLFIRGFAPDQIAQKLTTTLHTYVSELERAESSKR